ncbi:hypothetical protein AXG93_4666s1310 [Marchantia polymorpha subsp. ruderalis]|uniref:Uncharacterized protein n=1 Tax=Marchantia polymorpha subsp. ruderalis TaxID=1480154 RepID=A0A176W278_MARPO|nr:hypothetical protein AXG93_4666s1310 [Marchantia polymorpha subsp. ruderalis]
MNTLAPPPELSHATLDAALSAVRAYALSQGYAVLSKRRRRIGNKKDELSRDSILCVPTGPNRLYMKGHVGDTGNLRKREKNANWGICIEESLTW